jgi:rhodanese-related sulfurtransferase
LKYKKYELYKIIPLSKKRFSFLKRILWVIILGSTSLVAQEESFYKMVDHLTSKSVPRINSEELISKNKFILLDVRSKEEYDISHIKNALWIGEDDWDQKTLEELDKEEVIIACCSIGYRSEKLVKELIQLNFLNVYNLYGGVFEWINQGNSVQNNLGTTERIHEYNKNFACWLKKGTIIY